MNMMYVLSSALLRRATVHKHMGNFQLAVEDLRMVLMEEPQNAAATVGDRSSMACWLRARSCLSTRCHCICVRSESLKTFQLLQGINQIICSLSLL